MTEVDKSFLDNKVLVLITKLMTIRYHVGGKKPLETAFSRKKMLREQNF